MVASEGHHPCQLSEWWQQRIPRNRPAAKGWQARPVFREENVLCTSKYESSLSTFFDYYTKMSHLRWDVLFIMLHNLSVLYACGWLLAIKRNDRLGDLLCYVGHPTSQQITSEPFPICHLLSWSSSWAVNGKRGWKLGRSWEADSVIMVLGLYPTQNVQPDRPSFREQQCWEERKTK